MNGQGHGRRKAIVIGIYALLAVCLFFLNPADTQASKREKYGTFRGKEPDTYSIDGSTIYFYPKKIYYEGNKIVCYVYIVNKTKSRITGLSNVTLTIRNKNGAAVAKHTFKKKKNISIKKNKFKTVKYTFPKSSVRKPEFYFSKAERMSIRATYTYYVP